MTYNTNISKCDGQWSAETSVKIGEADGGDRMVKLRTYKAAGGLSSAASVSIHKNSGTGFFTMTTAIFGDFYKSNIAPTPCKRVTESAITAAHKIALQHFPAIIAEATAFYANAQDKQAA